MRKTCGGPGAALLESVRYIAMNKITKAFLILAIVCLVVGMALNSGLVDTKGIDVLYTVLPLGAVFAGLFLISKLLEKESARYDAEHGATGADHGAKRSS